MTEIESQGNPVTPAETAAALARMRAAAGLAPGSRADALLTYLIDHWHRHGPDQPPKAYAIGVDVLGRGTGFDPAQDSIVRVETGRLRKVLQAWAEGPGRDDPIEISLPKGGNGLQIRRRPKPQARTAPNRNPMLRIAALALLAVLAIAALILPRTQLADYPLLRVDPVQAALPEGPLGFLPEGIEAQLVAELSRFHSFRVLPPWGQPQRRHQAADYALRSRIEAAGEDALLTMTLTRLSDGAAIWSGQQRLDHDGVGLADSFYQALRGVMGQLAGPGGVIDADGRAQLARAGQEWRGAAPSAFLCELRWQAYDRSKDRHEAALARTCLDRLTTAGSPVGALWSAQAFMLFLDWTAEGGRPDDDRIDRALAAAHRAISLAPTDAETHEALGSILSALGDGPAARQALRMAARLNPSDLEIVVKLGWQDCLDGDWSRGVAEIRGVIAEFSAVPGWYRLPLALDALRRNDAEALAREARLILAAGDRRGTVLALAAARMAGDDARAAEYASRVAMLGSVEIQLSELAALFPVPDLIADLRAKVLIPHG
ncbi:hypothetical protein [Gemmobacter denitrificans]|uniref:Adenylate cyclase n=1 Tax=Gemmobacter denitrificans TaxID=3123040 RepID=A0ABU8BZM8_9RHOB